MQKLVLINNCTNIPAEEEKSRSEKLNVLFVGRNSEEKRAYLFEEIATQLHSQFPDKFTFTMIGNKGRSHFIKYIGEITDGNEMARHYKDADVLVLTSYREGFPMVIMEAMAHGTVPVATPVGDIPKHVTSTTGILTSSPEEKIVVKEICEKLIWLKEHPEELERLSENAYAYAKLNFSEDRFKQAYRKLFNV